MMIGDNIEWSPRPTTEELRTEWERLRDATQQQQQELWEAEDAESKAYQLWRDADKAEHPEKYPPPDPNSFQCRFIPSILKHMEDQMDYYNSVPDYKEVIEL